jgi:hypothetical protein
MAGFDVVLFTAHVDVSAGLAQDPERDCGEQDETKEDFPHSG